MRRSAISSSAAGRRARRGLAGRLAAAAVVTAAAAGLPDAKVFMTQEEALKLAFPAGTVPERRTAFLTDEQASRIQKESGQPLPSKVVSYYEAGGLTAWFDTHTVRTLPETIMVVVTPAGAIGRIDILSFVEPEDYLPRRAWIDQMNGRALDDELSLRRGVRPMTGATLTARAIVGAARRVLATHRALGAPPDAGIDRKDGDGP